MKKDIVIGVLAAQGDVSEHVVAMEEALKQERRRGEVVLVKRPADIEAIHALVMPGGESTVISRILVASGLMDAINKRIQEHSLPIFGTCAGCVLLAKKLTQNPQNIPLLNALDIEVERNAFGRQKDSFHQQLVFKGFKDSIEAVFIRGPIIVKTWNGCEVLASHNDVAVAVRQNEFLALSFHPELTADRSVQRYFLRMV